MTEKTYEAQPTGLEPYLPETKTNRTQISIRTSWGNCTTNNCQPPGQTNVSGLAACAEIWVQLPLTAQVKAIRYCTSAGVPNDNPTCPVTQAGENAWAFFDPAAEVTKGGFKYVYTTFHNRSENRVRLAALEVDYTE